MSRILLLCRNFVASKDVTEFFLDKYHVGTLLLLSVGPDISGEGEGGELLHLPRVFHFYRSEVLPSDFYNAAVVDVVVCNYIYFYSKFASFIINLFVISVFANALHDKTYSEVNMNDNFNFQSFIFYI